MNKQRCIQGRCAARVKYSLKVSYNRKKDSKDVSNMLIITCTAQEGYLCCFAVFYKEIIKFILKM